VFRFTAQACPERHLQGAEWLGADARDATSKDAGEVLAKHLIKLMRSTGIPNGISGVGYGEHDVDALSEGAFAQRRLLTNAPREVGRDELGRLFRGAMRYW
jgi:alcohol dehydrogenase class IV